MSNKTFDELAAETMTPDMIRRSDERAREYLAELFLREVRLLHGVSQRELADILGIKQPSVSKLEKQRDMKISTLNALVTALGGKLRVSATFPKGEVVLNQFDADE